MINVKALLSSQDRTNVYDRVVSFKNRLQANGLANFHFIHRVDGRTLDLIRFSTFSIRNIRSDIVHIFEPLFPNSPVNIIIEKLAKRPIILDTGDVHSSHAEITGMPTLESTLLRLMEELAMRSSIKIVVRGRGHRELLISSGIDPDRLAWIPDGIDFGMFCPAKSEFRQILGVEDKLAVGYVGTLRNIVIEDRILGRGWELIRAVKKLVETGIRNVVVIIVGDGPAISRLIDMVQKLDLSDKVIFTGKINFQETPGYINAMDICFVDSYYSIAHKAMINTKLLQYMACGKPIIAGNIGEAAYSLRDCGILINPCILKRYYLKRYVSELSEAIELLIDDEQLRKVLGLKARANAFRLYNWENLSKQLYILYQEVLEKS